MNYLEAFLREKTRAEKRYTPTAKADKTPSVSFGSEVSASLSTSFSAPPFGSDRQRWPHHELRPCRCGAAVRLCVKAVGCTAHPRIARIALTPVSTLAARAGSGCPRAAPSSASHALVPPTSG